MNHLQVDLTSGVLLYACIIMFIPQDYRQGDLHSRSIDYFVDLIIVYSTCTYVQFHCMS